MEVLAGLATVGLILALVPGGQETLEAALVLASVPLGAWYGLKVPDRAAS